MTIYNVLIQTNKLESGELSEREIGELLHGISDVFHKYHELDLEQRGNIIEAFNTTESYCFEHDILLPEVDECKNNFLVSYIKEFDVIKSPGYVRVGECGDDGRFMSIEVIESWSSESIKYEADPNRFSNINTCLSRAFRSGILEVQRSDFKDNGFRNITDDLASLCIMYDQKLINEDPVLFLAHNSRNDSPFRMIDDFVYSLEPIGKYEDGCVKYDLKLSHDKDDIEIYNELIDGAFAYYVAPKDYANPRGINLNSAHVISRAFQGSEQQDKFNKLVEIETRRLGEHCPLIHLSDSETQKRINHERLNSGLTHIDQTELSDQDILKATKNAISNVSAHSLCDLVKRYEIGEIAGQNIRASLQDYDVWGREFSFIVSDIIEHGRFSDDNVKNNMYESIEAQIEKRARDFDPELNHKRALVTYLGYDNANKLIDYLDSGQQLSVSRNNS